MNEDDRRALAVLIIKIWEVLEAMKRENSSLLGVMGKIRKLLKEFEVARK